MLSPKIFRKILQISSKKFGSSQDRNRFLIAEDDELASILHHVKATAVNLEEKAPPPHQAFHILHLPTDDAAFRDGLRTEKLEDPAIRGDGNVKARHSGHPARNR